MKKTKRVFIVFFCVFLMLTGCSNQVAPKAEVTLTSLGRASIQLDVSDGTVVYIDPFAGVRSDYSAKADLVLVTHQHTDHNKTNRITLKEDGVILNCPKDIKSGTKTTIKGFEITAVDAYNEKHSKNAGCGYIIKYGDLVIYHSGDTSTTEQMKDFEDFNIDYALLCMDGYYNMDPQEAMSVADLIKAQRVIPIHTSPDYSYSQSNVDAFTHESKLEVKMGKSIILEDLNQVNSPI